jgi:adenylate cyclase class 2
MEHREIECRFLEIDKGALVAKLAALGAQDEGEQLIKETVIYDRDLKWRDEQRFVRLRQVGDKTKLTYKDQSVATVDGTVEVELTIDDYDKAEIFFEKIGLRPFRHQEKRRHTFQFDGVTIDIDSWPLIPTYMELEGPSEASLRAVAEKLGLDWQKADFHNARWVIEHIYHIPVGTFEWYTFARSE